MRSFRRSGRKLSLLVVILTMLAGSASAFGQTSQPTNFTAAPLSPSDQATLAVVKNDARSHSSRLRAAPPRHPSGWA